jgi:hypothetical protein
MPIVPMKQEITVTKSAGIDGWGNAIAGDILTLKARVVEETKVVTAPSGREAATSLRITLDKLADITYDDTITFTNENGVTVERKPLNITVKRGISGKPMLTEVYV